jgi:hypothetical protein
MAIQMRVEQLSYCATVLAAAIDFSSCCTQKQASMHAHLKRFRSNHLQLLVITLLCTDFLLLCCFCSVLEHNAAWLAFQRNSVVTGLQWHCSRTELHSNLRRQLHWQPHCCLRQQRHLPADCHRQLHAEAACSW